VWHPGTRKLPKGKKAGTGELCTLGEVQNRERKKTGGHGQKGGQGERKGAKLEKALFAKGEAKYGGRRASLVDPTNQKVKGSWVEGEK